MGRGLALAAASTMILGCGLQDVGGLGESTPLGDSGAIDGGRDVVAVDTATIADEGDDVDRDALDMHDGSTDADGGCPSLAETDACKAIPRLLSVQIVDGDDGDFECVPTTTFDLASAATTVPKPPPLLPEVVHMRAAWTDAGLAIHVHVVDPSIVVAAVTDPNIYDGDAVEVFLSGFATLTGAFDGAADAGAMQIIVAPPADGAPARAKIYQNGDKGPLDPADYATQVTIDGYSIELGIPWSVLHGAGVVDAKVGLDLALDVLDDPTATKGPAVWAVWQQKTIAGKTSCPGTTAWAYCDDRSWCTPSLE